jgi:hypothetical protein
MEEMVVLRFLPMEKVEEVEEVILLIRIFLQDFGMYQQDHHHYQDGEILVQVGMEDGFSH